MKPKTNMKLEPEEYYMSLWRYPIPTNGNFQRNIVNNILMNLFNYELLYRRFKDPAKKTYKSIAIENNLII